MKICPHCAKEVPADEFNCRNCCESLNGAPPPLPPAALPWYFKTVVVVIALLSVGPLALPMVWWHPRLRASWKVLISAAVVGLTWLCLELTVWLLAYLEEQLRLLQSM